MMATLVLAGETLFLKIYIHLHTSWYRVDIYLLKVKNWNSIAMCDICLKSTIKTPERRSGVVIVNFEQISHIVLVFPLLALSKEMPVIIK